MVTQLNTNLAQKSITVTVTDEAKKWILNQTLTDRSYGARPLRRALQKYIEDPLSEALIQGTLPRPGELEIYLGDTGIYYRQVVEAAVPAGEAETVTETEPVPGTVLYTF